MRKEKVQPPAAPVRDDGGGDGRHMPVQPLRIVRATRALCAFICRDTCHTTLVACVVVECREEERWERERNDKKKKLRTRSLFLSRDLWIITEENAITYVR